MDSAEMSGPEAIPTIPPQFPSAAGDLSSTLHSLVQSVNDRMAQVQHLLNGGIQIAEGSCAQVHSLHLALQEIMPPLAATAEATKRSQTWGLVAAITAKISSKAILIFFVFVMFLLFL